MSGNPRKSLKSFDPVGRPWGVEKKGLAHGAGTEPKIESRWSVGAEGPVSRVSIPRPPSGAGWTGKWDSSSSQS